MPEAVKTISDAIHSRFQFGSKSIFDGEQVFYGAVIYGSDLTFDGETGLPTGGTIERIELQTRHETGTQTTHGVYSSINADAQQLNNAFLGADAPWFDPIQFFSADLIQSSHFSQWSGGAAADVFFGGDKSDTLAGDLGNDVLYGGGGKDLLKGDGGNDTLHGNDGKDRLNGNAGDDLMYDGAGRDTLKGGNDWVSGNAGDDVLFGGAGKDQIIGDDGTDILIGGDGEGQVQGNDGNDTFVADLTAQSGNMTIRDFKIGEDSIYLETGDVLSADELFTIFTAGASEIWQ